jgi:glycosyltransferase involved in cell wall biosynthesis
LGWHLRLLMLTAFPAIGGPLPKLTPLVAQGFRRGGIEVVVEGWSAHAVRESYARKFVGRLCDLMRIAVRDYRWRPDIIYVATAHNWTAMLRDVPLVLVLPDTRRRLVLHFHGSESGSLSRPGRTLFKALSRVLVTRSAAVLLLSHEEEDEWRAFCSRARYEVVLNPFVTARSRDACEGLGKRSSIVGGQGVDPTLLFVGRLIAAKGVFDLLEALRIVLRRRRCRLLIVGTGPQANEVHARIDALGLSEEVSVLGYLEGTDLDAAYRVADVFVLPSYFAEGFPLAVMEAMSWGLPVVTTRIRGCADQLVAGKHAVFVSAHHPELLATAIGQILDDPDLRQRMSIANIAKVQDFAPETVLPPYVDIVRSVAAGESRSH